MNAPVSPNLEKLLIEAQQGNHDAKDRLAAWMLDEAQRLAGFALRDSKKTMGQSSLISNALLKLSLLPDEKHRETAILRLSGYTNEEIADEMHGSIARTKQRLQRIGEIWRKSRDES